MLSTNDFIVAVSVADIHRDPDASSELVTQALMNTRAVAGDVVGEWTFVTLPDYAGWIQTSELELPIVRGFCEGGDGTCGVPLPYSLVVTAPVAPVYRAEQGSEKYCDVYLSTVLPYIDLAHPERYHVALPGEGEGWIPRACVDIRANSSLFPQQDVRVVTDYARHFLDVPYLWGGVSYQGLDCSGFVQLCYRMGGDILPRDAGPQQTALPQSVELSAMQEGDLIFFGKNEVTHVGLALNNREFIHAEGREFNRVVINTLEPGNAAYNARLVPVIWAIKRVRKQ